MQWPEWMKSSTTQWIIGLTVSVVLGVGIFSSPPSPSDNHSVHVQGDGNSVTAQHNIIDADALAEKLLSKMAVGQNDLAARDKEIKALKATIGRLQQGSVNPQKQQALQALAAGDTQKAVALMEASAEKQALRAQALNRDAAQDWLDIGNIAYLYDSNKALEAYQKALKLDPKNAAAWNRSGLILARLGKLDEAIAAYQQVLALAGDDRSIQAAAYGNLGNIYQTRGDLDKAESFHLKLLAIDEALGHQEGMAFDYGNLGILYQIRGDLDKACAAWKKSRDLFTAIGAAPMIQKVDGLIQEHCAKQKK
ncbi:MAG: tetratricopeptide repeat protein [Mariprofundaceae bacterium]